MMRQSTPTKFSIGTRGFDLIGFDMPDRHSSDGIRPATVLATQQHLPIDGLHLYSSETGARLFERMMDEFEDELFGPVP